VTIYLNGLSLPLHKDFLTKLRPGIRIDFDELQSFTFGFEYPEDIGLAPRGNRYGYQPQRWVDSGYDSHSRICFNDESEVMNLVGIDPAGAYCARFR